MRLSSRSLLCAVCSVCAFTLILSNPAAAQAPDTRGKTEYAAAELPDSPGALRAQEQNSSNQQDRSAEQRQNTAPDQQAPAPAPQAADTQGNQKLQRPVGTAAAEAPRVSGITAAQPAGIAIAPAKQHRVRTIAIKVGAIIGAGAAVGTVIALTAATPSKPPGAH